MRPPQERWGSCEKTRKMSLLEYYLLEYTLQCTWESMDSSQDIWCSSCFSRLPCLCQDLIHLFLLIFSHSFSLHHSLCLFFTLYSRHSLSLFFPTVFLLVCFLFKNFCRVLSLQFWLDSILKIPLLILVLLRLPFIILISCLVMHFNRETQLPDEY